MEFNPRKRDINSKINKVIKECGLEDLIATLPKGIDTVFR